MKKHPPVSTDERLMSEWDHEANEKDGLDPNKLTLGVAAKANWICKLGHRWIAKICNRGTLNRNCPYCSGQKRTSDNNLDAMCPELIKEWDFEENVVDPQKISYLSNYRVSWICNKGHKWKTSVVNRVKAKTNCPYCSRKKVSSDNNLSITHPELLQDWDYDKNINPPESYLSGTHSKVYWKCSSGHEWKSAINHRTSRNSGCPICSSSQNELITYNYLNSQNICFKKEFSFQDLKNINKLKFDFAIFKDNQILFLIEIQGEFHYHNPYSSKKIKQLKNNDRLKKEYCIKNNINLVEIHYKEKDIEKILYDNLLKYGAINEEKENSSSF